MERPLTPQEIRILDICRDIELASEQLYHYFSQIYCADDHIAVIWQKTAQEERNHANQFSLATKLKFGMIDRINLDFANAEGMLTYARSVLDAARNKPPSLGDALRSAIELEEKLEGFHMDCLATFTEESYQQMFKAMMDADSGHIKTLRLAYSKLVMASSP